MTELPDEWPIRCQVRQGGIFCAVPTDRIALVGSSCGCPDNELPLCSGHLMKYRIGYRWHALHNAERGGCGAQTIATVLEHRLANESDLPDTEEVPHRDHPTAPPR